MYRGRDIEQIYNLSMSSHPTPHTHTNSLPDALPGGQSPETLWKKTFRIYQTTDIKHQVALFA